MSLSILRLLKLFSSRVIITVSKNDASTPSSYASSVSVNENVFSVFPAVPKSMILAAKLWSAYDPEFSAVP